MFFLAAHLLLRLYSEFRYDNKLFECEIQDHNLAVKVCNVVFICTADFFDETVNVKTVHLM